MADGSTGGGLSGRVQISNRLTARAVAQTKQPGLYLDGGGLHLQVSVGRDGSPRKSWVLRYTSPGGKRREMGLGRVENVGLAEARERAREVRAAVAGGRDPLDERAERRSRAKAEAVRTLTFKEAAEHYIAAHEASWSNPKHRQQWSSTLKAYAYPVMGALPVAEIDTPLVLKVLTPIWATKRETASRLRGRIEAILDWATVAGHRPGKEANPARWRGHLEKALPSTRGRLVTVQHHRAAPGDEMPALWASLSERTGSGADCLAFLILTAARSGEARGAIWNEIDLARATWTIPASRMKAKREHRVPLTEPALSILRRRAEGAGDANGGAFVFPSDLRTKKMLSDMTLSAVLRRMGRTETVHGFRSTFRDWAAERTQFPREVAEAALAHTNADKVEAAYRRSDLFDRRKELMTAWAEFLLHASSEKPLDVALSHDAR